MIMISILVLQNSKTLNIGKCESKGAGATVHSAHLSLVRTRCPPISTRRGPQWIVIDWQREQHSTEWSV